jgi:hypothetical protein
LRRRVAEGVRRERGRLVGRRGQATVQCGQHPGELVVFALADARRDERALDALEPDLTQCLQVLAGLPGW